MTKKPILLLIIGALSVSFLLLSACKKEDETPTDDGPDYSHDKGTFKDSRDGKTYKWVKIGSQIWLAENLAYEGGGKLITDSTQWAALNDNDTDAGYCYYDNDVSNKTKYGILYSYAAALAACPDGWHLATDNEWTTMVQFIENDGHAISPGVALRAKTGWFNGGNGTDNYGFAALPGGSRNYSSGSFEYSPNHGFWWCVPQNGGNIACGRSLNNYSSDVLKGTFHKSIGFSVRCVKD